LSDAPHRLSADDQAQKPADAAGKTAELAADSDAEQIPDSGKVHGVITLAGLLPVPDDTLEVDPKTSGLKNVLVYLAKPPAGVVVPPVPKADVELAIRNGGLVPRILIVRVNRPIVVQNTDKTPSNLHTQPFLNQQTNHLLAPGQKLKVVYARAEKMPFFVTNDIMPGTRAWHLPLDHPWFAVTDAGGEFTISNLPAGNYEFIVWHERAGYLERKLLVPIIAGETTRLTPLYPREKFKIAE
jgi:hypothetical protein